MFKLPYTNLHELNLNWILNKLKKLVHMTVTIENSAESSGDFDENSGVLALKFPFGAVGPQGPQGPQGPGVAIVPVVVYEPTYTGTLIWSVDLNHSPGEYYKIEETFFGTLRPVTLDIYVEVAGEPILPVFFHTFEQNEVAYLQIEVLGNWVTLREEKTGTVLSKILDPNGKLKIAKTVTGGWRYQRVEMYPTGA